MKNILSRPFCTAILVAALQIPCSGFAVEPRTMESPEWEKTLSEERHRLSFPTFVETGASGLAAFSIGLYGAYFDNQGFVTSSVYSVLQTGGIILMAEGLRNYLGTSPLLHIERSFQSSNTLTRDRFRYVWQRSAEINQEASDYADLFMWTGLTGVYLASALKEPKSSSTMRSIYFFLATNGALLSGAAAYRLYFAEDSQTRVARSMSLSPLADGVALTWQAKW